MQFTHDNLRTLRAEQARSQSTSRMRYPLMKLIDMYFWQIGYDRERERATNA